MAGSKLKGIQKGTEYGILLPINYQLVILGILINLLSLNLLIYKVEAIMVPITYG